MVKLLIVDHHKRVREALESRLKTAVGMEIVGSTGCYEDAPLQVKMFAPDVVLIETKAPEGMRTLQSLCVTSPQCAIIVLTSYPDSREEDEAHAIGAARYLLKTLDTRSLVQEIRTVARHDNSAAAATPQST